MTSWAIPFPVATRPPSEVATTTFAGDPTVIAARSGDDLAFERLYRQHVGRVYALALRLCGSAAEADSLTQDTFVRAWERLATFRGESTFGTWLHRLAVNVILGDRRTEWRRNHRITASGDLLELQVAESRTPQPGIRLDLEAAIAALPAGARTVFVLHDVEGYEHAEIAELSGIAVGTSKAQLFRARRLLREALER
jgi:RNA polymerase sigma-70 factor (ECF subfamily)